MQESDLGSSFAACCAQNFELSPFHARANKPTSVHQTSLDGIMIMVERLVKGWLRWI